MRLNRNSYFCLVRAVSLLVFLGMVFLPVTVMAHRVTLFAWVDGKTIHTQSRFSGGRAVKNGAITVFDAEGNRILSGNTDEKGAFSFELVNPSGTRIVLDAGMGHGNEWVISAADGIDHQIRHDHAPEDQEKVTPPTQPRPEMAMGSDNTDHDEMLGLGYDQVKAIIDESMDKKLKPIMITLSKLQDSSPSISDILGGIGYIVGLVGLGAYMQSRKKNRDDDR